MSVLSPDSVSEEVGSQLAEPTKLQPCLVCGDRAFGCNFSVFTCESCKAFFRRNASREMEIKCPFNGTCEITPVSRRFCQKCRLNKCFQVGMKKEWILVEGGRRAKKARIVMHSATEHVNTNMETFMKTINDDSTTVNVPKRLLQELLRKTKDTAKPTSCSCRCSCGFYSPTVPLTAIETNNKEEIEPPPPTPIIQQAHFPNRSPFMMHGSNFTETPRVNTTAGDWNFAPPNYATQNYGNACSFSLPAYSTPPNAAASFINATIHSELASPASNFHCQQQPQPVIMEQRSELTSVIRAATENELPESDKELYNANEMLKEPIDLGLVHGTDLSLMDVVRITDLAVRRIIKMAKRLSHFKELIQEDQIALIKGSCSELLILRGVMVFDVTKNVWNHHVYTGSTDMEIRLDVLKRANEVKHYEDHKRFLTTFSDRWRKNENVMLILSAITLFSPDQPNLREVEKIRAKQERYYVLLKRYLDTQCSPIESQQSFDQLLRKLVDLHQLNQGLLRIYCGLNPNEVDPLLLELFDLKRTLG